MSHISIRFIISSRIEERSGRMVGGEASSAMHARRQSCSSFPAVVSPTFLPVPIVLLYTFFPRVWGEKRTQQD